jgi:glycosyltransferase involved in cell wall biosynthesis
MNICIIVHNNGTRDGRVMREAHTLRGAGHAVTVVGIPESGATKAEEVLIDGIKVIRVAWDSKRRVLVSSVPNLLAFVVICCFAAYGFYRLGRVLVQSSPTDVFYLFLVLIVLGCAGHLAIRFALHRAARRANEEETLRRRIICEGNSAASVAHFPAIRSRIPGWIPDWMLGVAAEPFGWIGAKLPRFSVYRYRSRQLASAAAETRPDVVHCHDCSALPTGWVVKKRLKVPLVYDAHEIYEAVAARRFGATDYFARVHEKYLPRIDGFVAVNDSAAAYYRHAFPDAPRAVVIRNATERVVLGSYDGRLHRVAELPSTEKILLYQGGFTNHRGLQTLVRSAGLLPNGWSLVMMGWGPLTDELKRIAQQDNDGRKARFIPPAASAELPSWTQGATVGIVPYEDTVLNHWIATPNKLWEYPNAGVPMIVQPYPEMRRIVEGYRCGWVLPQPFSAAAIAGLVSSLSEAMLDEARAGCRRFIEQDNWSALYRPRLLALYERLGAAQKTPIRVAN